MIFENVELHNVAEVTRCDGQSGVRLQRVPEEVRLKLNAAAQMRMLQPDGAEIRFLFDGPACRVTLSSEDQTRVTVFHGPFDGRQRFLIGKEARTIEISQPVFLDQLDGKYTEKMFFSPRVVRLILGGPQRAPVWFHGIQGEKVRPPEPGELPRQRYLVYGTSITHGFDAEGPHLTYVAQTARFLRADLINLGVGGAAHCEPELADYIATRSDWDFASLELSVNMLGFTLEEFYQRVGYFVNRVAGANTGRPVLCITLYPFFLDFGVVPPGLQCQATPEEYRQALRDIVAACPCPNVHLVEGPEILREMTNLTCDLIHPGDYGMMEMARHLTEKWQSLASRKH